MGVIVEKGDTSQIGRRAKDIDRYVGARVRERRMMSGITQHELAEMIDVTYQQMNKYETGINRISAGRLHTLAQALGVDAGYFFSEMAAAGCAVERPVRQRLLLDLARSFLGISKLEHQEALCALALALKGQDGGLAPTADPQAR